MSLGILTTRPTFGFLGPTPDLLSQTIREWGPRICILKGLQKILFSTSLRTAENEQVSSFPPRPRADRYSHGPPTLKRMLQLLVLVS